MIEKLERRARRRPFVTVFASIDALPGQVNAGWKAAARTQLPPRFRRVRHLLVSGMGGSALPAHLLQSQANASGLAIPLTILNGYTLPKWAARDTLVLLSSYSGDTIETLTVARTALRLGTPAIAVTAGGTLAALFTRADKPLVVFPTAANPSGQPRLGGGFALGAFLNLFSRIRALSVSRSDVDSALRAVARNRWSPAVPFPHNSVKQDAVALQKHGVLIIAPDTFLGNAHALANQINETAKAFAVAFALPELNHHLLESLRIPNTLRQSLSVLFLDPIGGDPAVMRRLRITREILRRQGFTTLRWSLPKNSLLTQSLVLLARGGYLSAYLALLGGVNPIRIPWVDFLKKKLR